MKNIFIWIAIISLISVIVTVKDKLSAVYKSGKRVRENTLFILGFMGGAFAMYLTMKLIRHKTRHKSFMVGLPLMTAFHVFACVAWDYL